MSNRRMERRRRKWARFRVKSELAFKAKILEGMDRLSRIQSLSLGGCSFLSRKSDARLLLNPNVRVSLEIGGRALTLDGVVHYCQFLPQLGLDKNIVGIEFLWPSEDLRKEFGLMIGRAVTEGCLEQMSTIEV
ncbi:MAG: hypothetical protein COV44_04160 [Deltaproteobacteria bacterium CG11_big_fil_rev_8_21_14_0_20_45_16]|nr:MAG: hypothetical protein COV44_04160 [Deltaproteobacteria bacterium CG11_big_fil_rev_8_21_14_0_20_45_16]